MPGYPPNFAPHGSGSKKSRTGLIIGLSIGGAALIGIMIFAAIYLVRLANEVADTVITSSIESQSGEQNSGILDSPMPLPPPARPVESETLPAETPPAERLPGSYSELVGVWELAPDRGYWVWFFGLSDFIMFTDDQEGAYEVYSSEAEQWGTWYIDSNGSLIVECDSINLSGRWAFTFKINGNRLTITDEDGDTINYIRQ